MTLFRFAHSGAMLKKKYFVVWVLFVPYLILYRLLVEWLLAVELPAKTQIGSGFVIRHGQALVVNDNTIIGRDVTVRHSTTIGNKGALDKCCPVIGDRVDVGSNVVILGGVSIGDDAVIGAGSVVVKDVPAGSVVVGNPARGIRSIYP
jgi:colanic acid biosynthesis acetyltransferase WcaB